MVGMYVFELVYKIWPLEKIQNKFKLVDNK